MKYYIDTNNKPFVFEDNVTAEIIAKVEATHNTTLVELNKTDYESIKYFGEVGKTEEQIKVKRIGKEANKKLNNTKQSLMQLCDTKQAEVQKMVLGYKATPMQLERYKDKYERALAGEFDDALNALIITKHEEYLTAIRNLVDLIEYFRSAVDDLIIAGNLDKANECIELAKDFDADTTLDEVKGVVNE